MIKSLSNPFLDSVCVGRTSAALFLVGVVALECLHRFTNDSVEMAISCQLENRNPVAWLFMTMLILLVALSLYVHMKARNRLDSIMLTVGLFGLAFVAMTPHRSSGHQFALALSVFCLGCSTVLIAKRLDVLSFAVVSALVISSIFSAVLLFVAHKPGIAERLLYLVFGFTTTCALNSSLVTKRIG